MYTDLIIQNGCDSWQCVYVLCVWGCSTITWDRVTTLWCWCNGWKGAHTSTHRQRIYVGWLETTLLHYIVYGDWQALALYSSDCNSIFSNLARRGVDGTLKNGRPSSVCHPFLPQSLHSCYLTRSGQPCVHTYIGRQTKVSANVRDHNCISYYFECIFLVGSYNMSALLWDQSSRPRLRYMLVLAFHVTLHNNYVTSHLCSALLCSALLCCVPHTCSEIWREKFLCIAQYTPVQYILQCCTIVTYWLQRIFHWEEFCK